MRSYHIKRDGGFMCGQKIDNMNPKWDGISFKVAHTSKLEHCCNKCKKRYFEVVSKLNIVV